MSQRLQIVLPDPVATQLHELAASAGEPLATLAGQLLRNGVTQAAATGKVSALKPSPSTAGKTGDRPRWLEPYGGDPAWRQETWGQRWRRARRVLWGGDSSCSPWPRTGRGGHGLVRSAPSASRVERAGNAGGVSDSCNGRGAV
jgi:hypothetical protein